MPMTSFSSVPSAGTSGLIGTGGMGGVTRSGMAGGASTFAPLSGVDYGTKSVGVVQPSHQFAPIAGMPTSGGAVVSAPPVVMKVRCG